MRSFGQPRSDSRGLRLIGSRSSINLHGDLIRPLLMHVSMASITSSSYRFSSILVLSNPATSTLLWKAMSYWPGVLAVQEDVYAMELAVLNWSTNTSISSHICLDLLSLLWTYSRLKHAAPDTCNAHLWPSFTLCRAVPTFLILSDPLPQPRVPPR